MTRPKPFLFFCPCCKSERWIQGHPKPQPMHYVHVAITALFFTCVTWPWFEWKGIVSIFPLYVGFEAIYRLRIRSQLSCPHCAFDPYLYLSDLPKARSEMEAYWKKKFQEKGIPYPESPGLR